MKKLFILLILVLSFVCYGNYANSPAAKAKNELIILTKDNFAILNSQFTYDSVTKVTQDVMSKINAKPTKDFYLILNTPGGSIDAGLEFIDNLKAMRHVKIHTITLFAASMGFITAQSLATRYITQHGTLMSHKARGGFSGEFGDNKSQLDSRYNYYLKRILETDKLVVNRTRGKHTLDSYRQLIENEYWCDSIDCIEQGFADKVADVICDKDLLIVKTQEQVFNFFGREFKVKVTKADCPLMSGSLGTEATIDGVEYNFSDPRINEVINNELKLNRTQYEKDIRNY